MNKLSKRITFELTTEDKKALEKVNEIIQIITNEMGVKDYLHIEDTQFPAYLHQFSFHSLSITGQLLTQLAESEILRIKGEK